MPNVEASVEVDAPVRVVYDQWTQFETFPQFMEGVKEVRQLDDSTLRWTAEVGGETETWEARIAEQLPDRRIAWIATDGKENGGSVDFDPMAADRTQVTVRLDWEADGMLEKLGGFVGADTRKVESDLERFKELIETRGRAAGGWRGEIHSGQVADDAERSSGSDSQSRMAGGVDPMASPTSTDRL